MKTYSFKTMFMLFMCLYTINNATAQLGKSNNINLPVTYTFDYNYKLKVNHKKEEMILEYYLKQDAEYFGFDSSKMIKGAQGTKMFMVMDSALEVTAMFMEMMGKKVVQKSKIKVSDFKTDEDMGDYTFAKIASKTINGYTCEGFISENAETKITCYIADNVPVNFDKAIRANIKNMPKGFNASILKKYAEKGLIMEMIYEDKNKPKNNIQMKCISLEKTDFSINTSIYGSMMGAFGR